MHALGMTRRARVYKAPSLQMGVAITPGPGPIRVVVMAMLQQPLRVHQAARRLPTQQALPIKGYGKNYLFFSPSLLIMPFVLLQWHNIEVKERQKGQDADDPGMLEQRTTYVQDALALHWRLWKR